MSEEDNPSFRTRGRKVSGDSEFSWGDEENSWEGEIEESENLTLGESGHVVPGNSITSVLSVSPSSGDVDTEFNFNATDSTNALNHDLTYTWEFGDGTTETGEIVTHTYDNADETYTVELTVEDEHGNTDTTSEDVVVDSQEPTAAFTVEPSGGDIDTEFTFDASDSTDPDETELLYSWTLGDGTTETGETVTYSYDDADETYTVELTVEDEHGNTDTATEDVTVDSQGVTAALTVEPSSGDLDTEFTFDASASTDPDGTELSYSWTLGDGTTETGETVTHTFDGADETYTVELTVEDEYGNTDTATEDLTVDSRDPTAEFTTDPETGDVDTEFNFNATSSSDPDETELSYSWTLGDGTTETGETVTYSYADADETYTVELTVEDEYGNTDTATKDITVDSRDPTAEFTTDPSSGDLDTEFAFDASDSSDPDDSDLSYSWTLGDGTIETGETVTHTYDDADETYTVELTVEDEYGNTDTATENLTVESRDPTAAFTTDPSTGDLDTEFEFVGNGSYDPDNTTLTYHWDFGDGTTRSGDEHNDVFAVHSYDDAGDYTVELTVEDEYGNTDTAIEEITVTPPPTERIQVANGEIADHPGEIQFSVAPEEGNLLVVTVTNRYNDTTEILEGGWEHISSSVDHQSLEWDTWYKVADGDETTIEIDVSDDFTISQYIAQEFSQSMTIESSSQNVEETTNSYPTGAASEPSTDHYLSIGFVSAREHHEMEWDDLSNEVSQRDSDGFGPTLSSAYNSGDSIVEDTASSDIVADGVAAMYIFTPE